MPLIASNPAARTIAAVGGLDHSLLEQLNLSSQSVWIPIFSLFSDTTSILAYGIPSVLMLAGLIRRSPALWQRGMWSFCIVLAADYLTLFVKNAVGRPRPHELYRWVELHTDAGNASFPSGHTVQAAAMAFGMSMLFGSPVLRAGLLAWAILAGLSRVCLGAHYPSDVAGAMLLALLVALLAMAVRQRFRQRP